MPRQNLQFLQKQVQDLNLSQTMRQSLMMLQMDMPDLLDFLKSESLGNPLFEVKTGLDKASFDVDDLPEGRAKSSSLFDYLFEQVTLTMRDTPIRRALYELIANLDENGYLIQSDAELRTVLNLSPEIFMDAKTLLQQLDPPGIGGQTLQECLRIQADRSERSGATLAYQILSSYFDDLVNHNYQSIADGLGQPIEQVHAAINLIKTFIAMPGAMFRASDLDYILPELKLERDGARLSLILTKFGHPQLVFAQQTYEELVQSQDTELSKYLAAKKAQYLDLQSALHRRADTLMQIARYVVNVQYTYFIDQSTTLKPLLMRDAAAKLQINQSTVSRAIHGVYIETDRGVFPLKNFFVRHMSGGMTAQSVDLVQKLIKQFIDDEDKERPLSDEQISQRLTATESSISRRTVAKYRMRLGIGSTKERRER
ncbi:RNA polymerase factor sigma-54 [Lacticaseibacillus pantheris]